MALELKDFVGIEDWIRHCGGEVLKPTNEWEIVRFRANGQVHVAYKNKHGRVSNDKYISEAVKHFMAGRRVPMSAVKTKRQTTYSKHKSALLHRDGRKCFYCGYHMTDEELTVEHIIALDKGGPNTLENMCLCHEECNAMADNLPIIKKIELRDQMQGSW